MSVSDDQHSLDQHANALGDFLPGGPLFASKRIQDSNFRKLLRGFAGELFTAEGYIKTFDDEYSPLTTVLFLDEWERALGIPDDCFPGTGSLNERRTHVLTKLAALGIQTADDFVALGAVLGVVLTVEALDSMAVPPIPIVLPQARYTIVVSGANVTGGFPPYNVPFTPTTGDSVTTCLLSKLKPANCSIIFVNS